MLVACDLVQVYWNSAARIASELHDDIVSRLLVDQRVTLTTNLRNTCDISDVLSVIRDQYLGLSSHNLNFVNTFLPKQDSGHFIRGPIPEFHIFDKHDSSSICNVFNKELIKLPIDNKLDECNLAVVHNDGDMLQFIKDTPGINMDSITMCNYIGSMSS